MTFTGDTDCLACWALCFKQSALDFTSSRGSSFMVRNTCEIVTIPQAGRQQEPLKSVSCSARVHFLQNKLVVSVGFGCFRTPACIFHAASAEYLSRWELRTSYYVACVIVYDKLKIFLVLPIERRKLNTFSCR